MKNSIIILFIIIGISSCKNSNSNKNDKIKVAQWLLGKWENKSKNGNLSETWTKLNDSVYHGQSYFIKSKDTLHSESIQLIITGENLFYISIINGQNNDKAIVFKYKDTIEKILPFENNKYDYPQKISYKQITKDSLAIEISGFQEGKPSFNNYSLKRAN